MNLHALRIFTTVAYNQSVTEAAKVLSISQPAVTIQIRNLEKETGLKLIETEGRGIKLTAAGEFLFKQAENLFDMEKEIENKLVQFKNGELEKLRISSTYLPANFLLPTWLAKFKKQFPLVKVDLYSGNSNQVIEKLLHYQTDIAFVVKEEWREPDLNLHHLMDIDFWFIVPRGHKYDGKEVLLSELLQEPFLIREEGSSTREILFSLCQIHGVTTPHIGLQFHGLNESIHAVIAGYGTMLAPSLAVEQHLERKEIGRVKVTGINITRPVYLCIRKRDKELSTNIKHFLQSIKETRLFD
ncbi:LysR family transcriptional regulator [Bacillus sp. 03113]|uniref:LysR family transcriptional regulator n=1 Tax=Bacillus sp. 03113 TaxID=2578211 RepID=UPI0011449D7B|nr:LysR family transcriptional regulator [Bacillus sp. 03113]